MPDNSSGISGGVTGGLANAVANGATTEEVSSTGFKATDMSWAGKLLRSNCIYDRSELNWYDRFNRFGALDPYNKLTTTKEYVFFTRPDCGFYEPGTDKLVSAFANNPYISEVHNRYPYVLQTLQKSSKSNNNPFMVILSNAVQNTVDFPSISANEMETPTNIYGTTMSYRMSGWGSDENVEFSLEFEDSQWLEIYHLVKSYEEYQRQKQFGLVYPPNIDSAKDKNGVNYNSYIKNRELNDTFGIYRFIVSDDFETLVYWGYVCGAYFKSVPRDAFNDMKEGGGLQYAIDFKAFCVDDMNPMILSNFNHLIYSSMGTNNGKDLPGEDFPIYSDELHGVDGDWALCPYIVTSKQTDVQTWYSSKGMPYTYKLKWRK